MASGPIFRQLRIVILLFILNTLFPNSSKSSSVGAELKFDFTIPPPDRSYVLPKDMKLQPFEVTAV